MLIHEDPKSPMTVYRAEDRTGIGPYRSHLRYQRPARRALGLTVAKASPGRGELTPDPLLDFDQEELEAFWDSWQFGFERRSDAETWFGKRNLEALKSLGFALRGVKASRVYRSKSGRQVMFVRCDGVGFVPQDYMEIEWNRRV